MAIWMELRCEDRGHARHDDMRCLSDDNNGPMEMAWDDNAGVLRIAKELRRQAKKEGWKRKKEGWICPGCAKLREKIAADKPATTAKEET